MGFIERANKIHNNKYDYSLVDYKNNRTLIKIRCKNHDFIFSQRPYNHIKGEEGCVYCSDLKMNTDKFIFKSTEIHKSKYDYSLVNYKNTRSQVKIICHEHGIFEQRPNDHLNGSGCPQCSTSKGETLIINYLTENNINFKYQYKVDKYYYDFYLPDYDLYIEYDGIQHYKPISIFGGQKGFEKLKIRDIIKSKLVDKLIRISYKDKNKISEKLISIKIK